MPGADADIAIVSESPMQWDEARAHDELNWSPYHGRRFACTVTRSYVGGRLAWDGQDIRNQPGDGRFVPRGDSAWFK
jgi:allantoinase